MSTPEPITTRKEVAARGSTSRLMIVGGVMLAVLALLAIAAPLIAPQDPEAVEVHRVLGAPDLQHLFGSDVLGRDVLSRIICALRVSLVVSISAVAASLIVAVPLGLVAGYYGSWVDTTISRTVDMILVLPAMLLAITFIAILGPGSVVATLAIAVIYLPILARVMRTSTLVVTRNDYVAGSRARGASHLRVIIQHVAPNALGPVIVSGLGTLRLCAAARGRIVVPRPWRATADTIARRHAVGWARCSKSGAVGGNLPRPHHRRCRACLHLSSARGCGARFDPRGVAGMTARFVPSAISQSAFSAAIRGRRLTGVIVGARERRDLRHCRRKWQR